MKLNIFLTLLLIFAGRAFSWHTWSGAATLKYWNNPLNWQEGSLPNGDDVRINCIPSKAPIIENYAATSTRLIIGDSAAPGYEGSLTINQGGSLTLNTGGYLRLGGSAGYSGIINVNGGIINQPDGITSVGYGGSGTLNVYDGEINVLNCRYPYVSTGTGTINIWGGIFRDGYGTRVGFAGVGYMNIYGGKVQSKAFRVLSTGRVDLSGGILESLEGDVRSTLQGYVNAGTLVAFNGEGIVALSYDSAAGITTAIGVYATYKCSTPTPTDGAAAVAPGAKLQWISPVGEGAPQSISYAVYIGTAPESLAYVATVASSQYQPPVPLEAAATYYWRVDALDASDGSLYSEGDVWSFTVRVEKVVLIKPADGLRNASTDITLEWEQASIAALYSVYLSTNRQDVIDGQSEALVQSSGETFYAAMLDFNTQYFWRVDTQAGSQTALGSIWTFYTGQRLCFPPLPADIDGNCSVDLMDLAALAGQWMNQTAELSGKRTRRIIMNNDGNDKPVSRPATPESFLANRFTGMENSLVDSVFYCTGVFNLYTHNSTVSEVYDWPPISEGDMDKSWAAELIALGTDSLEIAVDWAHRNNKEILWSMRMNDRHDSSSSNSELISKWKKDNPDCLMGEKGDIFPYGANSWSALRYGKAEVRDQVYRILQDVCSRYDIDGIELDFFRHPLYFIEVMNGLDVPQYKLDAMNDLIRRVRLMTTAVGSQRGRPLLVAIRVPDSISYCKAIGLDIETWLKEGLVDIVTGCDYFKLEPWQNLVALGNRYEVQVYAGLEKRRIVPESLSGDDNYVLQRFRGEAKIAWNAGIDGIYTFNVFNPNHAMFSELGDPQILATLPRIEWTAYVEESCWSKPETWLKNGRDYVLQP